MEINITLLPDDIIFNICKYLYYLSSIDNIDEAFNYYSGLWFGEHLDKDGNLYEYIDQKDAEYVDEFTFKESDHFYIGIPNTYAFEGITEDYAGYPGCELDEYGFEKMYNIEGKPIPYYDGEINN